MQRSEIEKYLLRTILSIFMMGCFQLLLAQSDTAKVGQNKTKIDELNQRLDNLVKNTSSIGKEDSVEIKLNLLLKQMAEVKQEISTIKTAMNNMSEENRQAFEELNNGSNRQDINVENGKFYVVIGSRRNPALAIALLNELKQTQDVILVKNSKKTWNHIILSTPYTKEEATTKMIELRKGEFQDAWWTSSTRILKD